MYYIQNEKRYLRTKIVATIGREIPGRFDSSNEFHDETVDYDTLFRWFLQESRQHLMIDILRLNMSYFPEAKDNFEKIFKWLNEQKNRDLSKNISVLGDLPGPKIRLGNVKDGKIKNDEKTMKLNFGNSLTNCPSVLINDEPFSDKIKRIGECHSFQEFIKYNQKKKEKVRMSLGDGKVSLTITDIDNDNIVTCGIEHLMGDVSINDKTGVTLDGVELEVDTFGSADKEALNFLLKNRKNFLGYIGVSFVKNANDILNIKYYIEEFISQEIEKEIVEKNFREIKESFIYKNFFENELNDISKRKRIIKIEARLQSPLVIAKIETKDAVDNQDQILDVADGLMVARGDLALQMRPEDVPSIQKELIRKCNIRGKPVITATEMLRTMEEKSTPTRAEASDVFNAVLDGTTAIMLSGETSSGQYPVHAVRTMVRIAKEAEGFYKKIYPDEKRRKNFYRQHFQEISFSSSDLIEEEKKRYKEFHSHALNEDSRFILSPFLFGDRSPDMQEKWFTWIIAFYNDLIRKNSKQKTIDNLSESACIFSEEKNDSAIIVSSLSGRTAKMISRFHPSVKILPVVHHPIVYHKMILSYGSNPIELCSAASTVDELVKNTINVAKTGNQVEVGQDIIYVAGSPLWTVGDANLIQLIRVE
jgi:pyruvate kinase